MSGPRTPDVGDVIRYSYLWAKEHKDGRRDGVKYRPCAIVLARDGSRLVVAPITHSPTKDQSGIELHPNLKRMLKLDDEKSWLIITEVNIFTWPSPEAIPVPGRGQTSWIYGRLPENILRLARDKIIEHLVAKKLERIERDDPTGP